MRLSVGSHVEDVAASAGEEEEVEKRSVALRKNSPCRLTCPSGSHVCSPRLPRVCVCVSVRAHVRTRVCVAL